MRYITNWDGYVVTVSFGADVECEWGGCTEYTGAVPTGYTSLEDWYAKEAEQLHRWKVVVGQLTVDATAAPPPQCNSWVDRIYPVGSIYMSVCPANPADLFGGTWQRIEDIFLLAAGQTYQAGTTGGEAEHTLTVDELPSHAPKLKLASSENTGGPTTQQVAVGRPDGTVYTNSNAVAPVGGGQPHNNMPPYLAVYVWQRVADPEEPDIPDSGLAVTDDGAGNVTIVAYGSASITDDGAGNVTIVDSGSTVITDDGAGNVTIF